MHTHALSHKIAPSIFPQFSPSLTQRDTQTNAQPHTISNAWLPLFSSIPHPQRQTHTHTHTHTDTKRRTKTHSQTHSWSVLKSNGAKSLTATHNIVAQQKKESLPFLSFISSVIQNSKNVFLSFFMKTILWACVWICCCFLSLLGVCK